MTSLMESVVAVVIAWPALAMLLKITLALGLGLAAVRLLPRARAAELHLVVAVTFAAVVAIPLVESAAPAWTVEAPLVWSEPAVEAAPSVRADVAAQGLQESGRMQLPAARPWSATTILPGLWLAGVAFPLGALGISLWKLGRVRRDSVPFLELNALAEEVAEQIGVRRPVELLLHEGISGPLTCGFARPAIILPAKAAAWKREDVLRALIHEMEHVRRRDWQVQVLCRIVCGVYWFHPLVWSAWRALRLNAERACDDAVVARSEATDYAEQLVGLARLQAGAQGAAQLGMASRSDLSGRVAALLNADQQRGATGRRAAVCALAVAALTVAAIAPVRAIAQRRGAEAEATPYGEALYQASARGRLLEIEDLLARGADVNAVVHGDGSPLIGAARNGRTDVVTFLLDRGADPDLTVGGDGSPLIVAAHEGYAQVVSLLLDRGANPNVAIEGDGNPLIAAARAGHLGIVETLLDRGARIEAIVPGDENALTAAASEGRLDVAQLLVGRGADVNAGAWSERTGGVDKGEWRTPLNMAQRNGHARMAEYLRSMGARE